MAGATLLRSMASKMARAPPRLLVQEGFQLHGRLQAPGPGPAVPSVPRSSSRLWLSSSSTSGSSMPPHTNRTGSLTRNKKVLSEFDWAKAAALETAPKVAYFMVFSGIIFILFCVNPTLDRINANLDASTRRKSDLMYEIKHSYQRMHEQINSKESQIEARDLVGQGKEDV